MDANASPPDVTIDPEDDATIFYTSGTTGRPKGAVGTHRNICTNLMSLFFINTRAQLRFGKSLVDPSAKVQSAILLSVPLFHATGCHSVMVGNMGAGGKIVMMHHFDPERALELIARERITTFGGVPAMVMQVLDFPRFAQYDTSSIRSVSYGGAPAPPDLVRRITGGLARRATVQRLRPHRDLVGHLHEHGRRLHRQAGQRGAARCR